MPSFIEPMKDLPVEDEKGRSSFQLLQDYKSSEQRAPLVYYVFDLLFMDEKDLRQEPLSARRKPLAQVLKNAAENIRLSDELRGTKEELLRVAEQFGLEGLVAKKPNSVYESGRRSGAWLGQIQDHQISGICGRRLHAARRKPEILWLAAGQLQ